MEYPNTFEKIRKYVTSGRPKKEIIGVERRYIRKLASYRLVYFDGPSPRAKVFNRAQNPNSDSADITFYADNSVMLSRWGRAKNFIDRGEIAYRCYFPIKGYPLNYEIPVEGLMMVPMTVAGNNCYLPVNVNEHITRFGYVWYRNLPLGQRWYVTASEVSPYGNFFQHRCKRYLKGTKFFSTECSLCGEDVTKTIDNLEEKIEATRAAFQLKNALGRTW